MRHTIPSNLGFTSLITLTLLGACAGEPEVYIPWIASQPAVSLELYEIIDHKTQASGQDIPKWVVLYEDENERVPGIERLPEYQDAYIFIGELAGTNFNILQQWSSGFILSKDLSGLVASRILSRLTKTITSSPEGEYGRFFEALIKAAFNTEYTDATQEADFWVLKQYFKEDGVTPDLDRKVYDFLILISINKTSLQLQINRIFNTLSTIPLTKSQTLSVSHLKETFYNFF
ncbi:MAG: hypothetical protein LBK43_08055 [Treponema sp.]|jgi:hypothetical protein|nr:hypothetical protein [Treponema sp.]